MKTEKLRQRLFVLADFAFRIIPMKKQVLFVCFSGRQYGDNTKALANYIHTQFPDVPLYWVVDKKETTTKIPSYFKTVLYNSIRYAWVKNRSRVIVENGAGIMIMPLDGFKSIFKGIIKKNNQMEVATWHGCPLKKIGGDIPNSPYTQENFATSASVLVASSDYERSIFERAFFNKIPVDVLGYARNDILFSKPDGYDQSELRRALKIPLGKKIILYAPTYRDNSIEMSGIYQLQSFDIERLLHAFSERFGGEWVFVYRFHNLVTNDDRIKKYPKSDNMIDGSISDDMADYLSLSDVLITDYSGSLFDVASTEIKCFLYIPDYNEYVSNRGLYLDISTTPYPKAYSFDQLLTSIKQFDQLEYDKKVQAFSEYLKIHNDGCACKRITDKYISKYLK